MARPPGVSLHKQPRGCREDRGAPLRPEPAQPHGPLWPGVPGLRAALSPRRTRSESGAPPASSVSAGPAESGSIRQPRGLRALPQHWAANPAGGGGSAAEGASLLLPPPLPPCPPQPLRRAGPLRAVRRRCPRPSALAAGTNGGGVTAAAGSEGKGCSPSILRAGYSAILDSRDKKIHAVSPAPAAPPRPRRRPGPRHRPGRGPMWEARAAARPSAGLGGPGAAPPGFRLLLSPRGSGGDARRPSRGRSRRPGPACRPPSLLRGPAARRCLGPASLRPPLAARPAARSARPARPNGFFPPSPRRLLPGLLRPSEPGPAGLHGRPASACRLPRARRRGSGTCRPRPGLRRPRAPPSGRAACTAGPGRRKGVRRGCCWLAFG